MSANHDIAKLDDLIVTTIDSVKGYEQAAESAPRGCYTSFFHEMARERREVVDALQMRSRVLGGTPADYGSAAGTVHRTFERLRAALGGGEEAIVKEVERGEDYLKEEYERVLGDEITSPETLAIIRRLLCAVCCLPRLP